MSQTTPESHGSAPTDDRKSDAERSPCPEGMVRAPGSDTCRDPKDKGGVGATLKAPDEARDPGHNRGGGSDTENDPGPKAGVGATLK